jgi:hypothetical protein
MFNQFFAWDKVAEVFSVKGLFLVSLDFCVLMPFVKRQMRSMRTVLGA